MKYLFLLTILAALSATAFSCNTVNSNKSKGQDTLVKVFEGVQELKVTVLPTIDGMEQVPGETKWEYPKSIQIKASAFQDELAAYGAIYEVWLAPKNWTGKGNFGANGNMVIELYPAGDTGTHTSEIVYCGFPACLSCVEVAAAPFFPVAMENYNADYNKDHKENIEIPKGLKITQVSKHIVTYTLPGKNGLTIKGVAYYSPPEEGDQVYKGATFELPEQQSKLADYLIQQFIETKMKEE